MSAHDVFTGSAGMADAPDGWTHTADGRPVSWASCAHGGPERRVTVRSSTDRSMPVVWFLIALFCLVALAAVTKPVLELVLWMLGYLP